MILKNSYNFNKTTKNQKYVGLLAASKKSFSPSLLKSPNPVNFKTIFFNTKSKLNKVQRQPNLTFALPKLRIKTKVINQSRSFVNELMTTNWTCFVYAKRMTNYKKIQTRFRSVTSDQKKRTAFDNHELTRVLLKSLLSVDGKASLERLHDLSTDLNLKNDYFSKNKALNKNHLYIGPGLLLEQAIYWRFIKKQAITKLRNRCILTGRASIIGKFRLSRISFRRYAGKGLIPGLIKRNN